jgi:CRISPR-associated protein Cst2
MAFITGLYLIDAPASALNNGQGEETKAKVKVIVSNGLSYPYVSAQSFRYWLRGTLENDPDWRSAPVIVAGAGKKQQAFTEGNPIAYCDDDLFGYMRAEKAETITRVSPFRTSTLVSIAPVEITDDFGVMARFDRAEDSKEGVLLHGHEFYRAILKGLFSLDLYMAGTFTYRRRTGFMNLGTSGQEQAQADGLIHLEEEAAYRLPIEERVRRVQSLLRAVGRIGGGAKQTLHYTDVTPAFVIAAVTKGGNNIFGRVITTDNRNGEVVVHEEALIEALRVFRDDLLSGVYVGRAQGFMDSSADDLNHYFGDAVMHPRQALDALAEDLSQNPRWLE